MAFPKGIASLEEAFERGRVHTQRILKQASPTTGGRWTDWSFASGQPAYDARIGAALAFTPQTDIGNEHIYQGNLQGDKHLASVTLRADGAGGPISVLLYDLLGFYPLIDGDSSDFQPFDNTLALPRYKDGASVLPLLVSSVAPTTALGSALLSYTDASGTLLTTDPFFLTSSTAPGQILTVPNTLAPSAAAISICFPAGSAYGIRSAAGIQYTTPPGGLQSLYLIRPVASFSCNGDRFITTERHFSNYPTLLEGCALNLFFYQQTAASTSFFGHLTFAS